jgi:hypothetical protein
MPQTEIKIVSTETGAIVPVGEIGEICARGYSIMKDYFDNPEATRSAIDSEGWLHTGDLGSLDEHGYCRVRGRRKDMIIRGGENISSSVSFPGGLCRRNGRTSRLRRPSVNWPAVAGYGRPTGKHDRNTESW